MGMTKSLWVVIIVSIVILGGMTWLLIATPAPSENGTAAEPFTSENVNVSSPLPSSAVPSTFTVTGEARGWYFEASFPFEVLDQNGARVGVSYVTAQSDWMTADFVPFIGEISVGNYSGPAMLVLHKDNPSGLPEHDDSVSFPIIIQ